MLKNLQRPPFIYKLTKWTKSVFFLSHVFGKCTLKKKMLLREGRFNDRMRKWEDARGGRCTGRCWMDD